MRRILLAFRTFSAILLGGALPADVAEFFGFVKKPIEKPGPAERAEDGALRILALLQRDSRLLDFLMEDVSAYSDERVGAAVRTLHGDCRAVLRRCLHLKPVIDGVEGTFVKLAPLGIDPVDSSVVKFVGNVPSTGHAGGGTLRHKGWQAEKIELPPAPPGRKLSILAPAEIEVD